MSQDSLQLWTAHEAAAAIAHGNLTSEALIRACLDQIQTREPVVRAWAHLDPVEAIAEAQTRDGEAARGPLHGVPVGIKDIIDVADMPCRMGSPIHAANQPATDASCVAQLRAAGAVILGKTVTAEFAATTPGPTTNPVDPARTPGGSSSGSAAAVAAGMVPLALGTQTGGSVLRPASFCGVIGFNPGFGGINRSGIKFAAESVDTIGIIARDLADVAICWRALSGNNDTDAPSPQSPPRLALCAGPSWASAAPESTAAVEQIAAAAADAGAAVVPLELPEATAQLHPARICINGYERARGLSWEWQHHRDLISPAFRETLAAGWRISYEEYATAAAKVTGWRHWLDEAFESFDAILTPAVNGVADVGLDSTGNPAFQELWTLLHASAISLPLYESGGLPVGVQLVGRRHGGSALLRTASWVMDAAPLRAA